VICHTFVTLDKTKAECNGMKQELDKTVNCNAVNLANALCI